MFWQWPAVTWLDSIRRCFICAVVTKEVVRENRYSFGETSKSLLSYKSNKERWCWQEDRLKIKNDMSFCTGCWRKAALKKDPKTRKHWYNIFCHQYGGNKSKLGIWEKLCFSVAPKFNSFYFPFNTWDFFSHRPEAVSPFFLMITDRFPKSHIFFFLPKDWNIFFLK